MAAEPIDDVEAWSKKLSPWRQDCLRRLATSNDLASSDYDELLTMIKGAAGFKLESEPPAAIPFTKDHFGGGAHQPIILKGIENIESVNRLKSKASISFCPDALTIIYGRNGSGKSGFVRILRTACRTRIENPAKLRVLADVYGNGATPQSAEIIIDAGSGDLPLPWKVDAPATPELMQVAVFDTASAQLYVDGGNQIRFLPFGLALPHRLNAVGLTLKDRLEAERATAVGNKVSLTSIAFNIQRLTASQVFNTTLTQKTTDAQIIGATSFTPENQARVDEITAILSASATATADLGALVGWVDGLVTESETVANKLDDAGLAACSKLKENAVAARQAAGIAATALFTDEPLPGVGSESWRALWAAARNYSTNEAYPDRDFPVTALDSAGAACVLCQQPLLADGAARMQRFQKYMDDTLDVAATKAETAVADAITSIPALKLLLADDFSDRLEQVRKRDESLATAIEAFQQSATKRRADAAERLGGKPAAIVPACNAPTILVKAFAEKLKSEKDAFAKANETDERIKLASEKAELEDRKTLASNRAKLITRRDLLVTDAA